MRNVELKHIAVDVDLFKKFQKLKDETAVSLGLKRLTFNQYMALLYNSLKK